MFFTRWGTRTAALQNALLADYQKAFESGAQEEIVIAGTRLLHAERSKRVVLGVQKWTIVETVLQCCAAFGLDEWVECITNDVLEFGETHTICGFLQYCFSVLKKEFPESTRVDRLEGVINESRGKYSEALNIYANLLAINNKDVKTRKRVAMCLFSANRSTEAVDCLVAHLTEFGSDGEAWQLLGDMYISQSCFPQAIFCYEELLLHNAQNVIAALTLADLLAFTKQYAEAVKYFCLVLTSRSENLRALWGVVWTVHTASQDVHVKEKPGQKHFELEEMREAQKACCKQLKRLYKKMQTSENSASSDTWNQLCNEILDEIC